MTAAERALLLETVRILRMILAHEPVRISEINLCLARLVREVNQEDEERLK